MFCTHIASAQEHNSKKPGHVNSNSEQKIKTNTNQTDKEPGFNTSPKAPWGEFQVIEEQEPSVARKVLLWLPNRLLDIWDIFRIDVGAGPSLGGVIRVSKYLQAGVRTMKPISLRVGDLGRQAPIIIERSNEIGIGPAFLASKERLICPAEIGLGVDLFIVGAYGGICLDEVFDFAIGIFTLDPKRDDFN